MHRSMLVALTAISAASPAVRVVAPSAATANARLASATAGCLESLMQLRTAVEANYAGYHLEVVGARVEEYARNLDALRLQAAFADEEACRGLLMLYLAWFDDPHLFLLQSQTLDSARVETRRAAVRTVDVDVGAVLRNSADGPDRDPIEGVWYDSGMRMAVIPDPAPGSNAYLAVVAEAPGSSLPPGTVRAEFVPLGSGRYATRLLHESFAETLVLARLHSNGLLALPPFAWGRVERDGRPQEGLDPSDPLRPTLRHAHGAVVVSLPTHDPGYRPVLDSLMERFASDIEGADRLVIDLRGNLGGSSWMSDPLLPYVLDGTSTEPDEERIPVMLSSPAQIRYAGRALGPDTSAFVRRLVRALEEAPGELVPMYEPGAPIPTGPAPDPIYGPRRVAVLIDGGTVSASEVLVLKALRSERATVIGTSTAGALDYQSIQVIRLAPEEDRWFLGYPTITAHADLPEDGMRGIGIAPEVRLDWEGVDDGIAAALRILDGR